jgi:hypothetical protein
MVTPVELEANRSSKAHIVQQDSPTVGCGAEPATPPNFDDLGLLIPKLSAKSTSDRLGLEYNVIRAIAAWDHVVSALSASRDWRDDGCGDGDRENVSHALSFAR